MKKMKKLFAVLLTLAMVMGMTMTTMAAKEGATITISGLATNASQNVKIYELYRLDDDDNAWVQKEWTVGIITKETDLEDSTKLDALKTKATSETPAAAKDTVATAGVYANSVSFGSEYKLQAGAYLVLVNDSSNKTTYNTMVVKTYGYDENNHLIKPIDATAVAKAGTYKIEKNAKDDDGVVAVDDIVTYEIKTTVPYVKSGETTSFKVTDTLTNAKYVLKSGTTNVVDGTVELAGVPKEVNIVKGEGETFTVDLSNFATDANTYAGQEVVITYTAKVGSVDTVTNKAESNHVPDSDVTVILYTGNAKITKYDESSNKLAGAEFALYKVVDGKNYYAGIDTNGYITGQWYEESNGAVPTKAGHVTTNTEGVAIVKGLDVGTYYFKEVVAPDGYSINTQASKVEVKKSETGTTVTGETTMTDTKLSALPSTGGIGTTIFTVAGCAIMIAAAALFFANRKKEQQ